MATKKRGLGKGFDILFAENATEEINDSSAVTLPINEIEPNKNQPRGYFDNEALLSLSESIAEHGVLQPLLVRPLADGSYQIVAGERRWRAAKMAGLTEVPAIVKTLSDTETAVLALIENLQREDLNPVEEAQGIRRLIEEFGLTQEQAAQKLSKSRPALTNALRLLHLPESVLSLLYDKRLSPGHARALLALENARQIETLAQEIVDRQLSVREVEKLVQSLVKTPAEPRKKEAPEPFYKEAEIALASVLGRKVRVQAKKAGGVLELEFFDKDDLKKLMKALEE
ncbi:MAG: ParB/RepB/Spo0J family partition protein [Oscillospiraceae bacterium]|nr:ParB/RepB/Spo0J family partition protein [Oscillospiraceae bacterium]